jgi:hypothetical protein
MAVYVTKACASQWPRRATRVGLFLVPAVILMTVFASTQAMGQAATPSPRAPVPRFYDEPPRLGERADGRLTTLNQAVDRFLKENLELRALHHEIPMAQADVEAAGQPPQEQFLIEVGLNGISASRVQPQELIPRRWVDILVARAVKRVLEAQYEDAVRTRVDRFYVEQARTELAKVERAVVLEVRQARLEYDQARSACDTFRSEILPNAQQLRDTLFRQFRGGEVPVTDYLSAEQEYNDRVFQVIKASVRLRRSALALNSAVGARIIP